MDSQKQRALQSFRRVQDWCAANPGLVPAPAGPSTGWPSVTQQADTLRTIVGQLEDAAARQKVLGTRTTLDGMGERPIRAHLRDEMRNVTRVARAVGAEVPGIGSMRMPRPTATAEKLLKEADALRQQAATYEAVLVQHGLDTDFLAQLDAGISALRTSIDARGSARAGQVSATKQVDVSVALGRKYVTLMDVYLTKVLKSDPVKLAEWKNARRVTLKGVPAIDATGAGGTAKAA